MGQVKTGTTALQRALHSAAEGLDRQGILYPAFGGAEFAHHLLLPLVEGPTRLPAAQLLDYGGAEAAVDRAWTVWNATCDAVAARQPGTLILSSEFLLQHTGAAAKAGLASLLSEVATDILPILYIRHPVDHFRARLQEWLKVESGPLPAPRQTLRAAIEDIEAAFPAAPALVAFDRSSLAGGDIAADFARRFLSPLVPPDALAGRDDNPGLSAEALMLLLRLRARAAQASGQPRRLVRLVRPLADLDRASPPVRPFTLHPEVAAAVLSAATCHRWLAETGRLGLPGLDPSAIDGTPLPDALRTAPPETLFPHDPARLRHLEQDLRRRHPDLPV